MWLPHPGRRTLVHRNGTHDDDLIERPITRLVAPAPLFLRRTILHGNALTGQFRSNSFSTWGGARKLAGPRLVSISLSGKRLHLVAEFAIPASEPRDAIHIAIAAVNGVESLATWNFKHIANAATRDSIEWTCRDFGCEPPKICTPHELMGA
jgi:hypothetical protein